VPERVGLPGFEGARRYVGERGYFTLYQLEALDALQTPEYADVIAHPTPWSARMRPRLSAFVRRPCEQLARWGSSHGVALSTVRAQTTDLAQWRQQAAQVSAQATAQGRLLQVTLAMVPADYALAYPVGGERIEPLNDGEVTVVCLLEHWDAALCATGAQWWSECMGQSMAHAVTEHFVLQNEVQRAALTLPAHARIAPRNELMHLYLPA
jgi:hypothetical protein